MAVFQRRQGIALINVLMFCLITVMMLVAGIRFTQASVQEGRANGREEQVYQVALAGLNHALGWLQAHHADRPTSFDPRVVPTEPDLAAETTTANEPFGIVKEYAIDADTQQWARYEVARSIDASPRPGVTNTGPSLALYGATPITWTVDDVSLSRNATAGTIWRARSRGYLWRRTAANEPFTLSSPKPLRAITLEGELRDFQIKAPRAAVYCFKNGADAGTPHLNFTYAGSNTGNTTISNGGDTGAFHIWANSSALTKDSDVVWAGSGYTESLSAGNTDPYFVNPDLTTQLVNTFGVTNASGIEGMADVSETTPGGVGTTPGLRFVYLNPGGARGMAVFNSATPLQGEGILFVDGSLRLTGTSAVQHRWQGLIFCTGHYIQSGNSVITGAVMAGQTVTIGGGDSNQAQVVYSQDALNRMRDRFSTFRLDRSSLKVVDGSAPTF